MAIDWDRPVQTRDGREVRIYARDGGGFYPVHGACRVPGDGYWLPHGWTATGQYSGGAAPHPFDLVNVPRRFEGWLNVYPEKSYVAAVDNSLFATRAAADEEASASRIACIPISFTEGEGLS